ncbi:hypothetical protein ABGT15_13095 [Flavobacterium enshiense]|uniref:hypothetical protein n=1 Tax=Flavobacterium enshiense TaxID=1341165 RepID=UPI00345D5C58
MINKITFLLILSMIISCSDKKENINNQSTSKENVQIDTLSSINKINTLSHTNETDTLSNNNDNSEVGYNIMENESIGKLKYGLSLLEVIELYGKPSEETKSVLWSGDGEYHQTIKYIDDGIELDVIGDPGTQKKINMITITNPSELKTLKNIGIGSDYINVKNAYKDQISTDFSNDKSIVVGSIYGGLIFTLKNNKVESIFIGSAAE